tara:strand:+ start:308 stop:1189 length:882 start_codon:yes stop_codon:yes gene_type:complete
MSFKDMKRKSVGSISELTKKLESAEKKNSYQDDRFWKPTLDKASNGMAVFRFLPAPENEDMPWAKLYTHAFKVGGRWYIENSRTTIGEKDPVSEMNSELWNSGLESDKDIARDRKRKLSYISNILVLKDPGAPENEGKVFLYKYGVKIFNKIQEAMQPEFDDEDPINPFDYWAGANFKLKVRKVGGYINYDKSEFESPSELLGGEDSKLEELWKTQHSLQAFVAPDQFKTYDELKKKLQEVVGDDIRATESDFVSQKTVEDVVVEETVSSDSGETEGEETDALSYFQSLGNED